MFKNKVDTYLRRAGYMQIKNVGLSISQRLPCPLAIWAFALVYILQNLVNMAPHSEGGGGDYTTNVIKYDYY